MKEVEISFYEIKNGMVECIADSFKYDIRQAFVWSMNTAKYYPEANHIRVFLDDEHEDYICFDKDESGIWCDSTYKYDCTIPKRNFNHHKE